jgi:hypothetical protein
LDFADEEENFLPGQYIFQGKKLYADIFVQHQPLAYIGSGIIQKIVHPQTISALVKTHRYGIILWSLIWSIILILRFGAPLFMTVFIYELTKITLLGNLFLAESLTVYPLIYLASFVLLVKKTKWVEWIFIGLLLAFLFYTLLPLWPFLGFVYFYLIVRSKKSFRTLFIFIIDFLFLTIIVFRFSSLKEYFINTIYITLKYYLPLTKNFSGTFSPLKSFIAPLLALTDMKSTYLLWVIKSLCLTFLINLFILFKKGKKSEAFFLFFSLGLASARYVQASTELYGAFHMNPWFSLLLVYTSLTSFQVIKLIKKNRLKITLIFLIFLIIFFSLVCAKYTLFDKRDPQSDLHVHYSPHYNYGNILRELKKPKDTLFVIPANMLLYWYSGIPPVSKYIFFYEWMEKTPLTEDVKKIFTQNPPTFLYCVNCQKSVVYLYLKNYSQLKQNGKTIPLFVIKNRFKNFNEASFPLNQ